MIQINGKKSYRTLISVQDIGEVVREYRPMKRTIRYKGRTKLIQLPYMIFAFDQGVLHVAVAKNPIRTLSDMVYFAPFGNTDMESWKVCGATGHTLSEAVQRFWQTEFNTDLSFGHIIRKRTFGGYREWANISKRSNAEQEVLDLIGSYSTSMDRQSFGNFIRYLRMYWGKWETHFDDDVADLPQSPQLHLIPVGCQGCPVRFVCPGSVAPASWRLFKYIITGRLFLRWGGKLRRSILAITNRND